MAQPHYNRGSIVRNFIDQVPEELIKQPDNSFHCLNRFVAATDASTQFLACRPIGRTAIANSSQPVSCSNCNCNSNDMTSLTNMTSIGSMGLVNGSTIVEGAMLLGGKDRWQ